MNRQNIAGGWVEYREPEEVPERLRREVTRLSSRGAKYAGLEETDAESMSEDQIVGMTDFMTEFNDAVALALISGWSYELPITKDGLLDLPGSAYDEIVRHCTPLASRLMPRFGVDGATDPKAPTEI